MARIKLFSRPILESGILLLIISVLFSGCQPGGRISEVTAEEILNHIKLLSDDTYEGRGLGTPGIELAARYHEDYFKQFGLKPFFGSSYRQNFTLIGLEPDLKAAIELVTPVKKGQQLELPPPVLLEDFVIKSEREDCPPEVEAELVYAGYLIQAPEQNWDDIKGMDLKGKALLVEINEPGNYPGGIFDGEDLTYYGRWTYKFEKATELGAAGVLIIHNDKGATYGWSVVRNSWAKESFFLPEKVRNLYFQGWVTEALGTRMVEAAGLDLKELRARAETADFKPQPLGLKIKVRQQPAFRQVEACNVVGWLPSSEPQAGNKYIIFSAHYDHLGRDPNLQGDQIYNGAIDNCSASACLLALAGYYSQFKGRLPANLVFAGVTAEEQGLLGSDYFASHLPVPNSSVLANINFETTNVWGETEDLYAIGAKYSDLDDICRQAAENLSYRYIPERGGNYGFFYRSDQLSFARHGIPAVWLHEGVVSRGGDKDLIVRKSEEYQKKYYHQVTDEVQPDWNLSGAVQIIRWAREVVELLGKNPSLPAFKANSPFQRPEVAGGQKDLTD
ncbi:MAG TPA: M28 family peptidase [Candidatus Saccharicenans sp.]|nr:M28 family peptidase [Candidatus Saccharicenans sp.]HPP23872.1 M28 family peptidase [Candidatus Saccharicenans sp.]